MSKHERAERANRLIEVIASCGRRFFHYQGAVACFEVDHRGRVWLHDEYSKRRIYTHCNTGRWRGFTHGGTLRGLIERLRDFIRTGEPQRIGIGEHWGYPDADAQKVRDVAALLGITELTEGNP